MRFGIISGAFPATPKRYAELLEEAAFADEMGFDSWGVSESHFLGSGVSAPEVILGGVAARTKRLQVRFLSVVLLSFNHPVRVAEQLATLDAITGGRAAAATARSQQRPMLDGFRIEPTETRAQWAESLEVVIKALSQERFEHHGRYWDIPPLELTPRPVQKPHPPLYAAATSLESHRIAGEKGLGVISGNSLVGGWPYVEAMLAQYRRSLAEAKPITTVNPGIAVAVLVTHCAETEERAKAEAAPRVQTFLDFTMSRRRGVAVTSPDYAYQDAGFEEIEARRHDIDHLVARAPYLSVGTPDFFVPRFRRLEAMGADEVVLEIEGMEHRLQMQTLELLGRRVLPLFRNGSTKTA
jgi:alkanesulfonate monooxygenase SsuD/methylene tetrahydromethanopterin reductase-like flavin-dependent oxidoreductase (luciferase family)